MTEPTSSTEGRGITGIGPGDVVAGKYRVHEVLGAGGMGVVFLARHTLLNTPVALKFLSRDFVGLPQAVSRFHREAQAAARLKSDHVVRVFDVGVHETGSPFIVMEHLEGGDLGRLLRSEGSLSIELAVDLVLQACSAMAEAHREGIVHRDLKPSNLFCVPRSDGGFSLKIVDFGISKLASTDQTVTVTGNFIGSPAYMPPEQMDAPNRVDQRADVWSLGVVLYECVTGKLPFNASTYPEMCISVTQKPPSPPRQHRKDLPVALERVILKCLEKDRERRFASTDELAAALREFAAPGSELPDAAATRASGAATAFSASNRPARRGPRLPSFSLTQPSWVRSDRPSSGRRQALWLGAAAVMAVLAAGAIAWSLVRGSSEPHSAEGAGAGASAVAPAALAAPRPAATPIVTAQARARVEPAPVASPPGHEVASPPSAMPSAPPKTSSAPLAPSAAPAARMRPAQSRPPAERDSRSPTWTR